MNSTSKGQIMGIIEYIREMDEMVRNYEKQLPEQFAKSEIRQWEDMKRAFVKQLIGGLAQSNFSLVETEAFLHKAIAYLNESQWMEQAPPVDLQEALKEVEQMLVVRAEKPVLKRRLREVEVSG